MDQALTRLEFMTIGFGKPAIDELVPAGSGTLVRVQDIYGVMTAAHVLENLPSGRPIGLLPFRHRDGDFPSVKVDINRRDMLTVRSSMPADTDGPDIGFLRLPHEAIDALQATSSVFYNVSKRLSEDVDDALFKAPYVDAIIGVVAERSGRPETLAPGRFRQRFQIDSWLGEIVDDRRDANGFDLLDVKLLFNDVVRPPSTFQGVSGGGLWRLGITPARDAITAFTLIGVPFFELPPLDHNSRVITCQGPQSIYGELLDRIISRWRT